jgi:hypothetical protein
MAKISIRKVKSRNRNQAILANFGSDHQFYLLYLLLCITLYGNLIYNSFEMGKKGVLLDNGKKAQSSMSLYWKKHQ